MQEIELLSYKPVPNEDIDTGWSVYFRPKFSVVVASTASNIYTPAHAAVVHSASKIKEHTQKQVHNGGEFVVGVMSMPKNGLQQSAEILSRSYEQLRYGFESILMKAKENLQKATILVQRRLTLVLSFIYTVFNRIIRSTKSLILHSFKVCILAITSLSKLMVAVLLNIKKMLIQFVKIIIIRMSSVIKKQFSTSKRFRTYISENLVLMLLIMFILVVSIVTVFQTILFFVGLKSA